MSEVMKQAIKRQVPLTITYTVMFQEDVVSRVEQIRSDQIINCGISFTGQMVPGYNI